MFYCVSTTPLDQVELKVTSACPKCGSNTWFVNTLEYKISFFFGSATTVTTQVVCAKCGKKIPKSFWPIEVVDLVAQKKKEFKPSFFKRFGLICILLALFVGIVSYVTIDLVSDHNKVISNAQSNFAKCYDPDIQNEWYKGLQSGDFILANKQYDDPARVFRVKSIEDNVVVLDAFEQSVPFGQYEELENLNQLKLGEGNFTEFRANKRYLMRGIVEEETDTRGLNNLYIKQIKKK